MMFDRDWADTVVHQGLERLRTEQEAANHGHLFSELKVYLSRPGDGAAYTAVGDRLGLSSDAVAMAVMRLRRRFRAIIRDEIANTVATPV